MGIHTHGYALADTGKDANKHMHRNRYGHMDMCTHTHTYRHADTPTPSPPEKCMCKQTHVNADMQVHRGTPMDTQMCT